MNQSVSGFKLFVNFGALCALIMFAMVIIIWKMGYFPMGESSILFSWLPFVFMFSGAKRYRDTMNGGVIYYWEAFKAMMVICGAAALLYVMLMYIFGTVIEPNFIQQYKDFTLQAFDTMKGSMKNMVGSSSYEKIEDAMIESMQKVTLTSLLFSEYLNKLFYGAILSLFMAFALRKKPTSDII
jgi:hypothetical protein